MRDHTDVSNGKDVTVLVSSVHWYRCSCNVLMGCQYISITDKNIQLPRKVRKSSLTENTEGLLWAPLGPEFTLIKD